MKFKQKETLVEAFKYDGDFIDRDGHYYVPKWAVDALNDYVLIFENDGDLLLVTLAGKVLVNPGDYIVKNSSGELVVLSEPNFSRNYYPASNGFTFGEALEALKEGKSVSRKGWNGKDQFVYLITGSDLQRGLKYGYGEYEREPSLVSTLAIKTSSNQIQVGWLATQSDMLSNDWQIVE